MGWVDALSPTWVYVAWLALVIIVLIAWGRVARGRALLAGGVSVAAAFLMPLILQPPITHIYGFIWQGRYSLPLFVAAAITLGFLMARERRGRVWVPAVWGMWLASSAINMVAFAYPMRRYAVGNLRSFFSMLEAPVWAPPGGIVFVLLMYAAGLVGLVIAAGIIGRRDLATGKTRRPATGPLPRTAADEARLQGTSNE